MNLDIVYRSAPGSASELVREFAAESGGPAWVIMQSFTAIEFRPWDGEFPMAFETAFAGCVFGATAEVRWVREDGVTRIWRIREDAGGATVTGGRKPVRYYLWGRYHKGRFREDIVPTLPTYPAPPKEPQPDDRPFLEGFEYFAPAPRDESMDAMMDDLNQPRVIAYRLTAFGCHRDRRENQQEEAHATA
jgi:hypothetical protein